MLTSTSPGLDNDVDADIKNSISESADVNNKNQQRRRQEHSCTDTGDGPSVATVATEHKRSEVHDDGDDGHHDNQRDTPAAVGKDAQKKGIKNVPTSSPCVTVSSSTPPSMTPSPTSANSSSLSTILHHSTAATVPSSYHGDTAYAAAYPSASPSHIAAELNKSTLVTSTSGSNTSVRHTQANEKESRKDLKTFATTDSKMMDDERDDDHPMEDWRQLDDNKQKETKLGDDDGQKDGDAVMQDVNDHEHGADEGCTVPNKPAAAACKQTSGTTTIRTSTRKSTAASAVAVTGAGNGVVANAAKKKSQLNINVVHHHRRNGLVTGAPTTENSESAARALLCLRSLSS